MTIEYHRLLRALPRYRWWKPILAVLIGYSMYFAASLVWQEGVLTVVQAVGGASARAQLVKAVTQDQQNASQPLVLLFTLGSLATMLPSVILAVRLVGLGTAGQLTSVVGRLRWRWMASCVVPALVYMGLTLGLGYVVPVSWQGGASANGALVPVSSVVVSLVIIVLLVPLQAAGEEFAFRGLGLQAFGSWFRWPVVGIVVPTVGFAFAHSYNIWGRIDVAALGVSFAYLTWRTGGLEAGIVAHVVNNVVVFGLAAPFATSQQSDGSVGGALISIVASAAYVGMIEFQLRRRHPARTAPGLSTGTASAPPVVGGAS
ncbi:CPBP family intramembrane glutamic endopeptidase [Frondihabitans australicus]|uniref:Membrane protease YdiL (CAAX protease family) n=1 Tax=Frondihabitans australicus TaxID=386892 RepID=A0A495IM74_9MICO|nr:CPBP family intramembrane glutamic endopeptidase [Frondihabitans australicus]RKR76225.1 membrane protease YdiL (CAAX protease family) [Frondihabitans australicus]